MEWINEYQALKQVNPANAFVVPANYFSEMEGQVMDQIRLHEFKATHARQEFTVPENYFDGLTQNIQSRIAINEVLNTGEGFTVPEGYFTELEQNIQSRIAINELLNSDEVFTVPQGYFNELEQNIQSRIAIEQNAGEEEFTVPAGYFEALERKILAKTTLQPAVKPVKEERGTIIKLWTKHAFKYASAACFSLIIGTGLFLSEFNVNSKSPSHKHSYLHKVVSKIPNDEIEAYLQLNIDVPTIVNNSDPDGNETVVGSDQTKN